MRTRSSPHRISWAEPLATPAGDSSSKKNPASPQAGDALTLDEALYGAAPWEGLNSPHPVRSGLRSHPLPCFSEDAPPLLLRRPTHPPPEPKASSGLTALSGRAGERRRSTGKEALAGPGGGSSKKSAGPSPLDEALAAEPEGLLADAPGGGLSDAFMDALADLPLGALNDTLSDVAGRRLSRDTPPFGAKALRRHRPDNVAAPHWEDPASSKKPGRLHGSEPARPSGPGGRMERPPGGGRGGAEGGAALGAEAEGGFGGLFAPTGGEEAPAESSGDAGAPLRRNTARGAPHAHEKPGRGSSKKLKAAPGLAEKPGRPFFGEEPPASPKNPKPGLALPEGRLFEGGPARPGPRAEHAALAALTTDTSECADGAGLGGVCASRRLVATVSAFAAALALPEGGPSEEGPAEPAAGVVEEAGGGLRGSNGEGGAFSEKEPPFGGGPAAAVETAAAALGCGSESCVLTHPRFRAFARAEGLPEGAVERELETRFKAAGPRYGTALLSNHNIDATLRRWARAFPELYPCPFAMMDFDRTQEPFARLDLADVLEGRAPLALGDGPRRGPRPCFACVVNTDVSTGRGKHWVAVFVDMRAPRAAGGPSPPPERPQTGAGAGPARRGALRLGDDEPHWSVEYFNSAGNPPPRPMVAWLERTRGRLAALPGAPPVRVVAVTDMAHQRSQTECGLYALYYIRRRLEGAPYCDFFETRVPDAAMTAFRQHCFRDGR